jgi:hypothetical protein
MKRIYHLILFALVIAGTACEKTDVPPLGEPLSKVEGLSGSWTLETVQRFDQSEVDLSKASFDISDVFIRDDFRIVFKTDGTYTVETGNTPNYFGTSGTWAFDDNEFPTMVMLVNGNGEDLTLRLNGPTRPVDQTLSFTLFRSCSGDGGYGYIFEFSRGNN